VWGWGVDVFDRDRGAVEDAAADDEEVRVGEGHADFGLDAD
jgi:hypothetical protein